MTKEEIRQAAQDWDGSGMATPAEVGAFIACAEWMQKRMIEEIAEWMRNFKDGQGNFPLYDYVGNFKQAMQDESK